MTRRELTDPFGSDDEDEDLQKQILQQHQQRSISEPADMKKNDNVAPTLDMETANVCLLFVLPRLKMIIIIILTFFPFFCYVM